MLISLILIWFILAVFIPVSTVLRGELVLRHLLKWLYRVLLRGAVLIVSLLGVRLVQRCAFRSLDRVLVASPVGDRITLPFLADFFQLDFVKIVRLSIQEFMRLCREDHLHLCRLGLHHDVLLARVSRVGP
jgi:hypothetical protein